MKNKRVFAVTALALGLLSFGIGYVSLRTTTADIALSPDTIYSNTITTDSPISPTTPVKLIFIHHSTGGHWLADVGEHDNAGGLGQALMENNYFVSATNYGWGPDGIGDRTDIPNWPEWFTDTIMSQVYAESDQNICNPTSPSDDCFGAWPRLPTDPGGENEIIMFKSCFPNSDLYGNPGDPPLPEPNDYEYTVANAKAVYNKILTYFAAHQDKLFVVIAAPPLAEGETASERAANARAFNNWLINDWLSSNSYTYSNVAIFDYYNVLTSNGSPGRIDDTEVITEPNDYALRPDGNHHYWNGSAVTHTQTIPNNYSAYPSGDSHPTTNGQQKATAEFVPLLNVFYNRWKSGVAPTPPALHLISPNGGENWLAGSQQMIQWTTTGTVANVNLTYSTDSFATRHNIALNLSNTNSYNWMTPVTTSTTTLVRVESVVSPTTVFDVSDAVFTLYQPGEMDQLIYLPLVMRNYAPTPPACAVPLTGVTISGPSSGVTNTIYTFNVLPTPANATAPIAYTWTPVPQSGQGTASATYQWNTTGSKIVQVDASNCSGTHNANDDHSITIQVVPSGDLLQPGDLTYLGAFRLPGDDADPPRTFAYGGNAIAFNPDGHITNTDVYPGSLFITGHDRTDDYLDGDQFAEVTIPVPVNSSNVDDLPYAGFLQGFQNVTAGHFQELSTVPKVGIQYLNHADTGPKVHITWGRHLQQLEDFLPSQAWVSADLATPDFQGEWFIGDQNPNSVNGYMLDIPAAWADVHAQGRYLATGRFSPGGLGGMGPALLAYRPWGTGGTAPVSGTHLSETPLLLYESAMITDVITRCLNDYQHADQWEGGAWLTTSSGKAAVLFAGTKGTGAQNWYGYIHPTNPLSPCVDMDVIGDFWPCRMADGTECPETDVIFCCTESDDCISARGWWSTRFDAQFILYDPADLAQVAAGTLASWEPQPYAIIDIDEHLYFNPPVWDVFEVGWGDQRRDRISAVAFDRANGYLYVLEVHGDEAKPMVHVWQVQ
ncbi:MAG: hypothetical protein JXR84_16975 [Anaerolineae bacterium]|nr:hypothetical protein [Anaerolineae bacterium]